MTQRCGSRAGIPLQARRACVIKPRVRKNPGNWPVALYSASGNHNVDSSIARAPCGRHRVAVPPELPPIPRVLLREPWAGRWKAVGLQKNIGRGRTRTSGAVHRRSRPPSWWWGQNDIHSENPSKPLPKAAQPFASRAGSSTHREADALSTTRQRLGVRWL